MRKIIIDTDIGDDIDDAFALLTALADPNDELLGVTTVFKNTVQRAHLAKSLLIAAGRGAVPVYAGHDEPLCGRIIKWDYERVDENGKIRIHHFRDEMKAAEYQEGAAEDFILQMAERYPGEVTLIAIGPLTNVAKAIRKDKATFLKLKEAYMMGGHPTRAYCEWNVRVDPEAADIFFRSGLPIHCVGLNVTTKCKLDDEEIARICACPSAAVSCAAECLRVWIASNNPSGTLERYPTMHDPLCVLSSQYADICTYEQMKLSVSLEGKTRSYTVADEEGGSRIDVATDVDLPLFRQRFFAALGSFSRKEGKTG